MFYVPKIIIERVFLGIIRNICLHSLKDTDVSKNNDMGRVE